MNRIEQICDMRGGIGSPKHRDMRGGFGSPKHRVKIFIISPELTILVFHQLVLDLILHVALDLVRC